MGKVLVIDYKMGNTDSVLRAVEKCGGEPILSNSISDFENASHIILPGVGAFQKGMENIEDLGIKRILKEQVFKHKIPFLGICLGMQLLLSEGEENGLNKGLNFVDGKVVKLTNKNKIKLPIVGWGKVNIKKKEEYSFL